MVLVGLGPCELAFLKTTVFVLSFPRLTCCCLDDDSGRLIGGFEDSTIHVWCLDNGDGVAGQQPIDWESLTGAVASSEGIPHPITPRCLVYIVCTASVTMPTEMVRPYSNHTVLRGHSGPVYSLECTQNGRHMLSASEDSSGLCAHVCVFVCVRVCVCVCACVCV